MRSLALLASAVAIHAQSPMPAGVVRGNLAAVAPGELIIRSAGALRSCRFDERTYFERGYHRIDARGLAAGDPIEVVADRSPGAPDCYARTVQVVMAHPLLSTPGVRPPLRIGPSPTEAFAPRGDFTFGGLVASRAAGRLTVKTRAGEIHVRLRPDTRYLGNGLSVDSVDLRVNTHVFVRAGRDLDGFLEAYQVIWGRMTALP